MRDANHDSLDDLRSALALSEERRTRAESQSTLFRLALEGAALAVVMVDERQRISFANARAENLFGYGPGELTGQPLEQLVPASARGAHRSHVERYDAAPTVRPMGAERHLIGLRKDGSTVAVEIGLSPVHTATWHGTVAVMVDVAERRRAERALKLSEGRYRAMVENTDTGFLVCDADGKVIEANDSYLALIGYDADEVAGHSVLEWTAPECAATCTDAQARCVAEGRVTDLLITLVHRDGRKVPISINAAAVASAAGPVVVAYCRDLSDQQKMMAELLQSNAELEQFAYVASHDLQEPLRMVASYTQLLGERYRGRLDEKADKFIDYSVGGAKRMQQLISDILAYAKLRTSAAPAKACSAAAAVTEALANLGAAVRESAGEVTVQPLPVVVANPQQLVQVFQNLLGNALKFRSDTPPRVEVSARRAGADHEFCVRDNGIGFAMEHAERVFAMFQRLNERDKYPGTGIGLAITRRIIERHGGRIWVESQPGSGASFFFTLPSGSENTPSEPNTGPIR